MTSQRAARNGLDKRLPFALKNIRCARKFHQSLHAAAAAAIGFAFLLDALAAPAFCQEPKPSVSGIVSDSRSHQPLAEVQIIAHDLDKGLDSLTVTGADGAFSFPGLEPGHYEIAVSKQGFRNLSAHIEIAAHRATRLNLPLEAVSGQSATSAKSDNPPLSDREKQLLERLERLEDRLAAMEARDKEGSLASGSLSNGPLVASLNRAGGLPTSITPLSPAAPLPAGPLTPAPAPAPTPTPLPTAAPAATAQAPATAAAAAPATPEVDRQTPFADYDWSWLNGNSRQHDSPLDTKYFSGEFRADTFYGEDFNQPKDHSMGGSSEVFRSDEFQLEDLSIGGDFHAGNMRGRVLALFGMFAATTVRNDASPAVGQWDVRAAYKYVSEAYGGYHFNVNHGLNVDAGIFVSYVGLFSYHNFDNWAYQPSYVSSNTPWFFNGVRVQWFPTNHLKIEPWLINGWQSYNKFNGHPGVGGQLKWTPNSWFVLIANQYGVGNDNVGLPHRGRYHTDDSIEVKYYDHPDSSGITRMAFTITGDAGCETGEGVTCHGGKGGPKQSFLGYMAYNRWWWHKDLLAFTLGGGQINNPGRYLALVLPINGADAISGTPYFPAYPGAPFKAYDGTATLDWMPSQFTTFRLEFGYRHTNVPYWSGRGGITPPGGNNGSPADYVCMSGASSGQTSLSAAEAVCGGGINSVWFPDLRRGQALLSLSLMVKL